MQKKQQTILNFFPKSNRDKAASHDTGRMTTEKTTPVEKRKEDGRDKRPFDLVVSKYNQYFH